MLKHFFKNKSDKKLIDAGADVSTNTSTEPQQSLDGQLDSNKIRALVAELVENDHLFQQAGFSLQQLKIEIGLSSKIICQFIQHKKIDATDEEKLIASVKNKNIIYFILISLFKSVGMKSMLNKSQLDFSGVEINITNPPSVTTLFKRKTTSCNNIQDIKVEATKH